ENLKEALKGETYEYTEMYPPMVAQAEAEGAKDALRSFSWALEAEKVHAAMYAEAIRQLESGEPLNLPAAYVICPLCGDTFPADTAPDKCPLCNMPKAKYIALA
ncbi:MAG: rubrerythrin family protein, partial [Akkermansia sp.]|nr:rubrerythrin family protein [Akkermansia sp.]